MADPTGLGGFGDCEKFVFFLRPKKLVPTASFQFSKCIAAIKTYIEYYILDDFFSMHLSSKLCFMYLINVESYSVA